MPGSLPSKRMQIRGSCDHCEGKNVYCDCKVPSTQCTNDHVDCDGYPNSRRAFLKGYTGSLEERVRSLGAEVMAHQKMVEEKDENIHRLCAIAEPEVLDDTSTHSQESDTSNPIIEIFEITKDQELGSSPSSFLRPLLDADIPAWVQQVTTTAASSSSPPAIKLLIVDTLNSATQENRIRRNSRQRMLAFLKPVLKVLKLRELILEPSGHILFGKPYDVSDISKSCHTYYLALNLFSLAWKYFHNQKLAWGYSSSKMNTIEL